MNWGGCVRPPHEAWPALLSTPASPHLTLKMSEEETKPHKGDQLITLSALIFILFFSLGCFLFFFF